MDTNGLTIDECKITDVQKRRNHIYCACSRRSIELAKQQAKSSGLTFEGVVGQLIEQYASGRIVASLELNQSV